MLRREFFGMLAVSAIAPKLTKEEPYQFKPLIGANDLRKHLEDYNRRQNPINKAMFVLHKYGGFNLLECEKIRKDICKGRSDKWVAQFDSNTWKKAGTETEAMLVWNCILVSFRCPYMDGFEVLDMNEWHTRFKTSLELKEL